MQFVKSEDGERINVVSDNGNVIAYVEKERSGTHGHWRGWRHYVYCERLDKLIWAGTDKRFVYPEEESSAWENWCNAQPWFANVKEVKAYYERK